MTDYKHEVRRPTDYNNGQIHGWNGGECPVHPETVVRVWLRGAVWDEGPVEATILGWTHDDNERDIIAFQVVKAYVEPKVLWVNEYPSCFDLAYPDEQSAREYANANAIRIAVKYQEVKE